MLIGYARVSTDDQNLDLQRDALQKAGCAEIYEDHIGGAKAARPGLQKALELAVKLYEEKQYTIDEICHMMGISKPTLYSYVEEVNK